MEAIMDKLIDIIQGLLLAIVLVVVLFLLH